MPKISELPSLVGTPSPTDLLAIVNGGVTKKMEIQQFPFDNDSLFFQGIWNSSANSPTLVSGTGILGQVYRVTVPGNTILDGYTHWQVGDYAVFNGTTWQKIVASNILPIQNTIYVSKSGQDTLDRDGSINYPYQSVFFAMSTITTQTDINPFTIIFSGQPDEPNQIFWKKHVSIRGENNACYLNNAFPLVLHSSWAIDNTTSITCFENMRLNNYNFDTSALTNGTFNYFKFNNVLAYQPCTLKGSVNNAFDNYFYNSYWDTNLDIHNVGAFFKGACDVFGALSYTLNFSNIQKFLNIQDGNIGNLTITTTAGGLFTDLDLRGSRIRGTLICDGASSLPQVDVCTYKTTPVLLNGGNVILSSVSQGLKGNYVPVNYTLPAIPAGESADNLRLHLNAIDNKFGVLETGNLIYKGFWNANTNTPTITSSVGTEGEFYTVLTTGTTTIDGNNVWNKNDWIYFNGTQWIRISYSVYDILSSAVLRSLTPTSSLDIGSNITNAPINIGQNNTGVNQIGSPGGVTQINSTTNSASNNLRVTGNAAPPFIGIGDDTGTSGVIYARSNGPGQFFANSVAGDACLRNTTALARLLIGSSSANSALTINGLGGVEFTGLGFIVPTVGGNPATFNYYEVFNHVTNTTGALALINYTIRVIRENNQIFYYFPTISANAIASANIVTSTALPTKWLPIEQVRYVAQGARNAIGPVVIEIATSGIITIYGNTSLNGFLSGQLARLDGCEVSSRFT